MFIIATSGRCGTKAICDGLAQFSDHDVRHEPTPTLLEEAWLKHNGRYYRTPTFEARMAGLSKSDNTAYGKSFRAPNLLANINAAAPHIRFLIVVRRPTDYVRSAHSRGVLRRGGGWDQFRLMPQHSTAASLAARIASHWQTINEYLLDFADRHGCPVVTHRDWGQRWTAFRNGSAFEYHQSPRIDRILGYKAAMVRSGPICRMVSTKAPSLRSPIRPGARRSVYRRHLPELPRSRTAIFILLCAQTQLSKRHDCHFWMRSVSAFSGLITWVGRLKDAKCYFAEPCSGRASIRLRSAPFGHDGVV